MKLIQAKYGATCRVCRGKIAAGEQIMYDGSAPRGSKSLHPACVAAPATPAPEAPSGTPFDQWPVMPEADQRDKPSGPIDRAFDDMTSYTAPRPMRPDNLRRLRDSFDVHVGGKSAQWFGVSGGEKRVVELVKEGWPDGVRRMLDSFGKLTTAAAAQSVRRVLVRDDHGDEFDVHRGYRGEFDRAWRRRRRGLRRTHRLVTLLVNQATPYFVHSDALFWRGACALALADVLGAAGYGVEVHAGHAEQFCAIEGGGASAYSTRLKAADDPVDMNNLAAGLCLAGFFRVFGFADIASAPYAIKSSFGQPASLQATRLGLPPETIVVDERSCGAETGAKQWLAATIERIESGALAI